MNLFYQEENICFYIGIHILALKHIDHQIKQSFRYIDNLKNIIMKQFQHRTNKIPEMQSLMPRSNSDKHKEASGSSQVGWHWFIHSLRKLLTEQLPKACQDISN